VEERPEGLADAEVVGALARHWGIAVSDLRYLPVGFGGYHWSAQGAADGRWFVTATELAGFGSFAGLEQAMSTAVRLARAGLEFVLAPVLAASGLAACPAGSRYAITVSPWVDGFPRQVGRPHDVRWPGGGHRDARAPAYRSSGPGRRAGQGPGAA
jgi:spectinomycin phosphotransferase